MKTIRNEVLIATTTVFERADMIDAQMTRILNRFHGNVKIHNTDAVMYSMIGNTDWSDYTDDVDCESEQVRELFREIFNLRKLGSRMVNKFNSEQEFPDLYVRAVISWKHHLARLKEKLFHYSYSVNKFEA